ncbi:MAG: hypothetical protein J6O51_01670 [Bacteroidales bacterium]|nr:hypothetical protein [Bacteroidales bacterium]
MDHDDTEDQIMVNTLRYVPEIKYISYKDLPKVYQEMLARSAKMSSITGNRSIKVSWPMMDEQLKKIKGYVDAAK